MSGRHTVEQEQIGERQVDTPDIWESGQSMIRTYPLPDLDQETMRWENEGIILRPNTYFLEFVDAMSSISGVSPEIRVDIVNGNNTVMQEAEEYLQSILPEMGLERPQDYSRQLKRLYGQRRSWHDRISRTFEKDMHLISVGSGNRVHVVVNPYHILRPDENLSQRVNDISRSIIDAIGISHIHLEYSRETGYRPYSQVDKNTARRTRAAPLLIVGVGSLATTAVEMNRRGFLRLGTRVILLAALSGTGVIFFYNDYYRTEPPEDVLREYQRRYATMYGQFPQELRGVSAFDEVPTRISFPKNVTST